MELPIEEHRHNNSSLNDTYLLYLISFWLDLISSLTRKLYGKSRLADVKVSLKLNCHCVQGRVDSFREQRPTELCQRHFILRWPIPNLQHVMAGFSVKGQKLEAVK